MVKVGMNTGRVISGVVGLQRPQFSLFGVCNMCVSSRIKYFPTMLLLCVAIPEFMLF